MFGCLNVYMFVIQSHENSWTDVDEILHTARLWYGIAHGILCIPEIYVVPVGFTLGKLG